MIVVRNGMAGVVVARCDDWLDVFQNGVVTRCKPSDLDLDEKTVADIRFVYATTGEASLRALLDKHGPSTLAALEGALEHKA